MICILGAYLAVSFGWMRAEGFVYQIINLLGSIGNLIYYRYKRAYSGEILDGVWALVALVAIIRLMSIYL